MGCDATSQPTEISNKTPEKWLRGHASFTNYCSLLKDYGLHHPRQRYEHQSTNLGVRGSNPFGRANKINELNRGSKLQNCVGCDPGVIRASVAEGDHHTGFGPWGARGRATGAMAQGPRGRC